METVAILDFETTGLSSNVGDRATEIAVNLVRNGSMVDRFVSLMNPERPIPSFVQNLTGITNEMVAKAPRAAVVMREAKKFVGSRRLVAHNASFDRKFWEAELARAGTQSDNEFAWTKLLARRVYPSAPSYRLSSLTAHLGIHQSARAHRAMADAQMAADLFVRLRRDLCTTYCIPTIPVEVLWLMQRWSKQQVAARLRALAR